MTNWLNQHTEWVPPKPDWSEVVHEDERFWAWALYLSLHIKRGELYGSAREFPMIAGILETWIARLNEKSQFEHRRKEAEFNNVNSLGTYLFPEPTKSSLKGSVQKLVDEFVNIREIVEERIKPNWRVTEFTIRKVKIYVDSM